MTAFMVKQMSLSDVLAGWTDGDGAGWDRAFLDLLGDVLHLHNVLMIAHSIGVRGEPMREPILLSTDGRVWDGHHRLCAAVLLRMDTVPVEVSS